MTEVTDDEVRLSAARAGGVIDVMVAMAFGVPTVFILTFVLPHFWPHVFGFLDLFGIA